MTSWIVAEWPTSYSSPAATIAARMMTIAVPNGHVISGDDTIGIMESPFEVGMPILDIRAAVQRHRDPMCGCLRLLSLPPVPFGGTGTRDRCELVRVTHLQSVPGGARNTGTMATRRPTRFEEGGQATIELREMKE